jgi:hypothetical protein
MTYVVMIQCPSTDQAVPTGLRCDLKTFSGLIEPLEFECPACFQAHRWSTYDAWLRDPLFAEGEFVAADRRVSASD